MTLTEDKVREALKNVIDPELFVNIVDLGLVYHVDIEGVEDNKNKVTIDLTLTSPTCPAAPQVIANSKRAIERLAEVAEAEVKIVLDPPWTTDRMTDDARDQLGIF
jgi:metal-sulfur cluster biosynthetic enzyme